MTQIDVITSILQSASELKIGAANEATTRLKLIDEILFGLLGWDKHDVKIEERVSEDDETRFSDYIVSSGRHSIVIEAKRIGRLFTNLPRTRKSLLNGAWAKIGESGGAVVQARNYGRKLGVSYCVATNGISWIVFPVNRRDQISFEDSLAAIFPDITKILEDDPSEFIDLLSRQSVISGSLDRELVGGDTDQSDPRRLNLIYDKSFSRVNRASIFHAIEKEIITAFNESLLSENVEVLRKCYVETPERIRFDNRINMYLKPRDQVLKTRPIRPVGRKKDKRSVNNLIESVHLAERPIALLTVGLVGSGKTTFLEYISKISAEDKFTVDENQPKGCWINVDFREFNDAEDPHYFIIDQIFRYVKNHPYLNDYKNCLSNAYAAEFKSLITGPLSLIYKDKDEFNKAASEIMVNHYNQKEPYIENILKYITKFSPVFIVIDNVDQIEAPDKQSNIFLKGTAIARNYGCNLVLAMRDSTYVKNRSSAVFDAFDFDSVYIDPPNIQSVLSKRFTVAAQLLTGQNIEFVAESGATVKVNNGQSIINMLSGSVLGTEVGEIIEITATGDTRLALKMTRQFLQYGYSATGKALQIYQKTGKYRLPPHEALRAIMLGNQNIYREDFSVFGNPMDSHLGRSDLQFLRIYLMSVFVNFATNNEFEGILARDVVSELEKIGVGRAYTEKVVKDLIGFRYLMTKSHSEFTMDSILMPSRLCGYVVRELIARLMFLETIMFETFIVDSNFWEILKSEMKLIYRERNPAKKFGMRKSVVKDFFKYCREHVELHAAAARARGMEPQWCVNPLKSVSKKFEADLDRASRSAKRTYASGEPKTSDLPLFVNAAS